MTVREAYQKDGFAGVWRWAKGHLGRWIRAKKWARKTRNWFRRRRDRARYRRKQVWSSIADARDRNENRAKKLRELRNEREHAYENNNLEKVERLNEIIERIKQNREDDRLAIERKLKRVKKLTRKIQNAIEQVKARNTAYKVYRRKVRAIREAHQEQNDNDNPPSGIIVPNRRWNPYNRQICAWMVPWLDKIDAAGWNGVVVSGVRTPAQSQALCINMCGNPTCPGTCAGIYSNHNATTGVYPQGALDVSDYWTFGSVAQKVGAPLRNDLPNDRVHFSVTGH